jgi:hypothetical protein
MLIAASAPSADYESIVGDLHEEYVHRVRSGGVNAASKWYWSQTIRSLPALLVYSRTHRSPIGLLGVALTALAVLVAMFLATMPINAILQAVFGDLTRCPAVVSFLAYWLDAAVFGALLGNAVRGDGVRLAFLASSFLVLCYVIPALIGFRSSQAPLAGWVLLWGAIPAMCAGAAARQVLFIGRSRKI